MSSSPNNGEYALVVSSSSGSNLASHVVHAVDGLAAPPSWSELSQTILHPSTPPPSTVDSFLRAQSYSSVSCSSPSVSLPTLYRDRNGWCVQSARLWLALEVKGIDYSTVLVEPRGDTYDGSPSEYELDGTDGWPEELEGLPQLSLEDCQYYTGHDDVSCMSLLRRLDEFFPDSKPIWPSLNELGETSCSSQDVLESCKAFLSIAPNDDCRQSNRAAWLFCAEEGYRLDALPRETFERVLDATEELLKNDGPFFCGDMLSAADIFWSPLLERYAAQLPCLHSNLRPRSQRWPNLNAWYNAMDHRVPEYACRVRGDGKSWRKVLYREPWWPSEDVWHARETVGEKGELKATEEEVVDAFGTVVVSDNIWNQYAAGRRASTPSKQTAMCLLRNRCLIQKDVTRWIAEWGYIAPSKEEIDFALRVLICILNDEAEQPHALHSHAIKLLGMYFNDRLCVPRDMGAPVAACLREVCEASTKPTE